MKNNSTAFINAPFWQSWGLLLARIIIAGVFAMAFIMKIMNISSTASYIASVGLPFALPLACIAAVFEIGIFLAFLSGIYFREAALLAFLYILFLGFMFHGLGQWASNKDEFGFFIDHFTFAAGLLALVASGPGKFQFKIKK